MKGWQKALLALALAGAGYGIYRATGKAAPPPPEKPEAEFMEVSWD